MKDAGGSTWLNEITLCVCVCVFVVCIHNWLMRQHSQGGIQQTNSLSQTVLNNTKRPLQDLVHSSLEAASRQRVNGALGRWCDGWKRLKVKLRRETGRTSAGKKQPTSELSNHVLVLLQGVLQDFLSRVHLPAPLGAHGVGVVSWRRKTRKHTHSEQKAAKVWQVSNAQWWANHSRRFAKDKSTTWLAGGDDSECRYSENWEGLPAPFTTVTPQLWQQVSKSYVKTIQ